MFFWNDMIYLRDLFYSDRFELEMLRFLVVLNKKYFE